MSLILCMVIPFFAVMAISRCPATWQRILTALLLIGACAAFVWVMRYNPVVAAVGIVVALGASACGLWAARARTTPSRG